MRVMVQDRINLGTMRAYANGMRNALSHGLNGKPYGRWWKVYQKAGQGSVIHQANGKRWQIYGFYPSMGYVYSLLREKKVGKDVCLVAYFYENPEQAEAGKDPLKKVIFSKKENSRWKDLERPEDCCQGKRKGAEQFERACLGQLGAGDFDFGPGKILPQGSVRIGFPGEPIYVSGFKKYAGRMVWGRIITEENAKKVYFWLDESRENPPLNSEGRIVARLKDGGWKIVWVAVPDRWGRVCGTLDYGNYLFSTANGKERAITWLVTYIRTRASGAYLQKRIRGVRLSIYVSDRILPKEVFSVTEEFGQRFKIVSFWESENDWREGVPPFAKRYITFRPTIVPNAPWQFFWERLDNHTAFRQLLREGMIARQELEDVLNGISGKHSEVFPVIDKLFVSSS